MNRRDSAHDSGHASGHPSEHGSDGDAHDSGHPPSSVGPKATRVILTAFFAICALLVIADFVYDRHMEHPLEDIPAFYTIYGLIGVGGLILAAKGLRRIVMRSEDYYDDE